MKVGDIYVMQWGYDQTNNTFYRVKALRGKTQAIIQKVDLEVESSETQGCAPMAGNFRYNPKSYRVSNCCVFIPNNEKGRIVKRKRECYWEPELERQGQEGFYIDHHFCRPYKGERVYESWYA